ncbi:MAG TPA: DUF4157 domain-containing protein [Thermoflexia bacterium]|nr:DUF4157 domain-containing protein [Thermoflexia bacterium]
MTVQSRVTSVQSEKGIRKPTSPPLTSVHATQRMPQPALLQRAIARPELTSPEGILALQRSVGNRAVSRLIQTKLRVGAPGDRYEREADRVAAQVMRLPAPAGGQTAQRQGGEEEELQAKPLASSITPLVQRQEEEEELQAKPLVQRQEEEEELQAQPLVQRQEEEEELQAKPLVQRQAGGGFMAGDALEQRLATQQGGGSPLPDETRAFMEPRFGADFSGVRVHTNSESAQLNREINSQAFTHGQDIYFRPEKYDPGSDSGKQLLAHELTHTLQQGGANYIQGWWPKGHQLITKLAVKDFVNDYTSSARNYLVGRSPDIDFINDGFKTMKSGIKKSKKQLKAYHKLIREGKQHMQRYRGSSKFGFNSNKQAQKVLGVRKLKRAKAMYDNNELHVRKKSYMRNHGEGGYYKQEGTGVNKGVTNDFIAKAVGLWKTSRMKSLSILSDALHQAEDRGSHGEGNPFTGHDVRKALGSESWETEHYDPTWEPDNVSVNKQGAFLAVKYAKEVLRKFADDLALPKGKIATKSVSEKFETKRRMRIGGFIPIKSSNWLVKTKGKTGVWTLKGLKKIVEAEQKKQDDEEALMPPDVLDELEEVVEQRSLDLEEQEEEK